MEPTTSGAKAATATASRRGAASSARPALGRGTKRASKPTSETAPASRGTWTPQQARDILSQTATECLRAGLALRIYNSTRSTVIVELLAHRIDDGVIVPTDVPTAPADVPTVCQPQS